ILRSEKMPGGRIELLDVRFEFRSVVSWPPRWGSGCVIQQRKQRVDVSSLDREQQPHHERKRGLHSRRERVLDRRKHIVEELNNLALDSFAVGCAVAGEAGVRQVERIERRSRIEFRIEDKQAVLEVLVEYRRDAGAAGPSRRLSR